MIKLGVLVGQVASATLVVDTVGTHHGEHIGRFMQRLENISHDTKAAHKLQMALLALEGQTKELSNCSVTPE